MRPVGVGGVEERDAQFKRAMDCRDRFLLVASAVKIGHSHAAKSQGGNDQAAASKFALFHNKRFTEGNEGNEVSNCENRFSTTASFAWLPSVEIIKFVAAASKFSLFHNKRFTEGNEDNEDSP